MMRTAFARALFCAAPLLLASTPAASQVEAVSCVAERAVYTMLDEDGEFRIALIPAQHQVSAASDLYLKLTTPQRSYWFNFSSSNGYGGITILPVSDPYAPTAQEDGPKELLPEVNDSFEEQAQRELLATLRFIALDKDLKELPNAPLGGEEAPPYLLLPEIGSTLWYAPSALSEDQSAQRDPMSRNAFRLVGCMDEAPPKAWP